MKYSNITNLINEVNEIRKSLTSRGLFRTPGFLHELCVKLKNTRYLCKQPIVQCFIEDAMNFDSTSSLAKTKKYINEAKDNNIFSLFDASYFPSLSLEYMSYRKLRVNEYLKQKYPSPTMPVNIEQMTAGFESPIVVALFPENHIDHIQSYGSDLIFYFINKFVERHKRITQKMIKAIVAGDTFALLRKANDAEMEKASTYWVWLHEYHHRQGDMPISKYLKIKSLKPLAGLEECRVDISAMLVCLNDRNLPKHDAALAYEFILSERLLRYSVQGIKPNYDAISSQLLFNYLIENKGLFLQEEIIHLAPNLPLVLAAFLEEIKKIESFIHQEEATVVQKRLLSFTKKYTFFDKKTMDYKHIPYFRKIKKRLQV